MSFCHLLITNLSFSSNQIAIPDSKLFSIILFSTICTSVISWIFKRGFYLSFITRPALTASSRYLLLFISRGFTSIVLFWGLFWDLTVTRLLSPYSMVILFFKWINVFRPTKERRITMVSTTTGSASRTSRKRVEREHNIQIGDGGVGV